VKVVYLSLGSNLGDRLAALQAAVDSLQTAELLITRTSGVYETAPVDFKEQPDFLNIVVQAQTSLLATRLLQRIERIEREMGRKRTVPKGPRTVDIDILLYGSFVIDTAKLQIPHPRMQDRRFVLAPVGELASELRHPVTRLSVREMLAAAPHQLIRRTALLVNLSRADAEKRT
jgi:2-amino-4-hydroxy-6-hydroxymethyldihydropteridine diphosphokinase